MGMLARGFTTVRDAGGADFGLAQAIEEGLILGPRLLFTGDKMEGQEGLGWGKCRMREWSSIICKIGSV
jgi:imidazolonepropionase-like amidohydrolase